jgi:hypothetical protein
MCVYTPIIKIKTELKKRDIPDKVTKINFIQVSPIHVIYNSF